MREDVSLESIDVEGLERKDRGELAAIATALGGKPTSRTRKADIIGMILDLAGVTDGGGSGGGAETPSAPEPATDAPAAEVESSNGSTAEADHGSEGTETEERAADDRQGGERGEEGW